MNFLVHPGLFAYKEDSMSHRKRKVSSGRTVRAAPKTQATSAPLALLLHDPEELRRTMAAWSKFIDRHLHEEYDEVRSFARMSLVRRAAAHTILGEHEAARADIELALAEAAAARAAYTQIKALEVRATIQMEQGDEAGALASFMEIWPLVPTDLPPEERAELWLAQGKCHARLKRYAEAIQDFSQAITLDARLSEAWGWRALAHAYLGQKDLAEVDVSQAITREPQNATWYHVRGVIRRMANRFAASLTDLLRAEALGGDPLAEQSKWETLRKWLLVEGPDALEGVGAVLANAGESAPTRASSPVRSSTGDHGGA
jgi:tetratricopeptide (TPR) repeat protein